MCSPTSLTSLLFPLLLFLLLLWCVPPSLPLCLKVGRTALMKASAYDNTATVELLLEAGADKEAKSEVRVTKREKSIHTHVVD